MRAKFISKLKSMPGRWSFLSVNTSYKRVRRRAWRRVLICGTPSELTFVSPRGRSPLSLLVLCLRSFSYVHALKYDHHAPTHFLMVPLLLKFGMKGNRESCLASLCSQVMMLLLNFLCWEWFDRDNSSFYAFLMVVHWTNLYTIFMGSVLT